MRGVHPVVAGREEIPARADEVHFASMKNEATPRESYVAWGPAIALKEQARARSRGVASLTTAKIVSAEFGQASMVNDKLKVLTDGRLDQPAQPRSRSRPGEFPAAAHHR